MNDIILQKYEKFLTAHDYLIIYDVKPVETDLIIPIDKIMIEISRKNDFTKEILDIFQQSFSDEWVLLCHEMRKFIINNFVEDDLDKVFAGYINTMIYLKKYTVRETVNILRLFSVIYENAVYFELGKSIFKFYELGVLTILEFYKEKIPDKNTFLFMSMGVFSTRIKIDFIEYINFIGLNIYKAYLNQLYVFIKNEDPKNLNAWYITFIQQCLKSKMLSNDKIEEIMQIFIKHDYLREEGLALLKKINSSYTDKYKAALLMKELRD